MNERLPAYLRRDKRLVDGWLQRVDAEIIGAILAFQEQRNVSGSCVEIGVHHGKSFIPLCLALRGEEKALGIDVFDDQSRNLDGSGRGDLAVLQRNLARFAVDPARVRLLQASSEDVDHGRILDLVGPARFFSIDGGHWASIVRNDLGLAERALTRDGVIALDDYFRVEWPEVTESYALWQRETGSDIVPFAAGSNKLFLCRKDCAAAYREALQTPFLRHYRAKRVVAQGAEFDVYRVEPVEQDETPIRGVLSLALKIFRPRVFVALKSVLRRRAG